MTPTPEQTPEQIKIVALEEQIRSLRARLAERQGMTYREYREQIEGLAECAADSARNGTDYSDACHEAADGSFCYYSDHEAVMEHTDNPDAIAEVGLDFGQDDDWTSIRSKFAGWAVLADVRACYSDTYDDDGHRKEGWFVSLRNDDNEREIDGTVYETQAEADEARLALSPEAQTRDPFLHQRDDGDEIGDCIGNVYAYEEGEAAAADDDDDEDANPYTDCTSYADDGGAGDDGPAFRDWLAGYRAAKAANAPTEES